LDDQQKTGVAIETQAFSLVTSGKKRETLKGITSLKYWPLLREIEKFRGMPTHFGTEVCVSAQRKFSLVTFIDTPGLVDGIDVRIHF